MNVCRNPAQIAHRVIIKNGYTLSKEARQSIDAHQRQKDVNDGPYDEGPSRGRDLVGKRVWNVASGLQERICAAHF